MNKVESAFLQKYTNRTFMEQQKSKILMYFVITAFSIILYLFFASILFSDQSIISGRNIMRIGLIIVSVSSLLLLKRGNYNFAANLILFGSIFFMGLQMIMFKYPDSAAVGIRLYYLYIFVVIAAVLCTRISTVICMIVDFAIFGFIVYHNKGVIGKDLSMLIEGFVTTLIFISVLSYLLLTIVRATFIRIAEDEEKENKRLALTNLLKTVKDVSGELSNLASKLAGENQQLSKRTTEQASYIEEIAATMEETTASIARSAENTDQVTRLAVSASEIADEGVVLVKEVVMSIDDINTASNKISDIINMINEIAFQTNLLALNAAVEAARAGDSGRGFAVVAGEVRNLAQRSAAASKEVEKLIAESKNAISAGTTLVKKNGALIGKISDAVKGVSRGIAEINDITREQRVGIEQVNTTIMEIDTATQQNAQLVEKTASASDEISVQAKKLTDLLNGMQNFHE